MQDSEFALSTDDGQQLFAQAWEPSGSCAGLVGIVHGLGEHSGRYAAVAESLTSAGYAVVAFDQRGHGRSGGARGHVASYGNCLDDVGRLVELLHERSDGLPQFLYGHSLGGNLVLNFALRRQPALSGLVVSSPLLLPARTLPGWLVAWGRFLDRVWPQAVFSKRVDPADLSHDPAAVEAYRRDPLVHHRVSARLAVGMLDAGQWALQHADRLALPTLLMHGGADRVTSAAASHQLAGHAGQRCTLKIWDGLFHELHWERQRAEVCDFMIQWMRSVSPSL